jgi:hypothetical protein
MIQKDSDFVDDIKEDDYENCIFKKDKDFGKLLETKYKHALLQLIFQYSKKYVDNDYQLAPYPDEWKEQTQDVMLQNDKFKEFFEDNFELDPNGIVCKRVIDEKIQYEYKQKVNWKDEFKRMRLNPMPTYTSNKRAEGERKQGYWTGFRVIQKEEF